MTDLKSIADCSGQERFVTAAERKSLPIAQHELEVAMRQRAQLGNKVDTHDV